MAQIRRLGFFFYTIAACGLLLLVLEGLVRAGFPGINHQDTQLSLFKGNAFGATVGLAADARGESFGAAVITDRHGFRRLDAPEKFSKSWLLLGDSVAFGVGVDAGHTFAQFIQSQLPDTKLWNTAVPGYSIPNYRDVLDHFLATRTDIDRVLLFLCLNDVYGNFNLKPRLDAVKDKTLSFLRRKSKLYMLLKNTFFDRSRTYALHDIAVYRDDTESVRQGIEVLKQISDTLKKRQIRLQVFILPYEYQLRKNDKQYLLPQNLLGSYLQQAQIEVYDAYEYFLAQQQPADVFYLYADAMHLSVYGHRVAFRFLQKAIF